MKLRITSSSIRLRLSQTDVRQFAESGSIQEELRLGGGALTYRLIHSETGNAVAATLAEETLTVTIPAEDADRWTGTDQVGIEGFHDFADGSQLSILIEKDFACLTPRAGDDDRDTFPHPAAEKSC